MDVLALQGDGSFKAERLPDPPVVPDVAAIVAEAVAPLTSAVEALAQRVKVLEAGDAQPDPPSPSPWLPVDLPARDVLDAAPWVMPHYFVTFPVSMQNEAARPDYVDRWLKPGGVEGGTDNTVFGGVIMDRKPFRAKRPEVNWKVLDKAEEIRQVRAAGMDGFFVDVLNLSDRWAQFLDLLAACDVVGDKGVKIVPMPDGTTSATADPKALAAKLLTVIDNPYLGRRDGKVVIAPYMPERAPAGKGSGGAAAVAFWVTFKAAMAAAGHPVFLWFCHTLDWVADGQAPAFAAIADGFGRWGERDPLSSTTANTSNALAADYSHSQYGKPWLAPVSVQDYRPNQGAFWEAGGVDQLYASAAIAAHADAWQVPTWDDFAEGAMICPTVDNGYGWTDLVGMAAAEWKVKAPLPVKRDGIYLVHRIQPVSGVTYTGRQSKFPTVRGRTPVRDEAQAVVFLTAPATVELTVGGNIVTADCPVGRSVVRAPLRPGQVSCRVLRAGAVTTKHISPHVVSTTQPTMDLTYKATSSLRG